MNTYYINHYDIVAETMRVVNQKEDRRIIDQKDIAHFVQIAHSIMEKDGITCFQYQNFSFLFDQYFELYQQDNRFYFVLFPWVKMGTLEEKFTKNLPNEVFLSLRSHQDEIVARMPLRDKEEQEIIGDVYDTYLDSIQEQMKQSLSEYEAKVRMLTYRIHMTQKRGGIRK